MYEQVTVLISNFSLKLGGQSNRFSPVQVKYSILKKKVK